MLDDAPTGQLAPYATDILAVVERIACTAGQFDKPSANRSEAESCFAYGGGDFTKCLMLGALTEADENADGQIDVVA